MSSGVCDLQCGEQITHQHMHKHVFFYIEIYSLPSALSFCFVLVVYCFLFLFLLCSFFFHHIFSLSLDKVFRIFSFLPFSSHLSSLASHSLYYLMLYFLLQLFLHTFYYFRDITRLVFSLSNCCYVLLTSLHQHGRH